MGPDEYWDGGWSELRDGGEGAEELWLNDPPPYDMPHGHVPAHRFGSRHGIVPRRFADPIDDLEAGRAPLGRERSLRLPGSPKVKSTTAARSRDTPHSASNAKTRPVAAPAAQPSRPTAVPPAAKTHPAPAPNAQSPGPVAPPGQPARRPKGAVHAAMANWFGLTPAQVKAVTNNRSEHGRDDELVMQWVAQALAQGLLPDERSADPRLWHLIVAAARGNRPPALAFRLRAVVEDQAQLRDAKAGKKTSEFKPRTIVAFAEDLDWIARNSEAKAATAYPRPARPGRLPHIPLRPGTTLPARPVGSPAVPPAKPSPRRAATISTLSSPRPVSRKAAPPAPRTPPPEQRPEPARLVDLWPGSPGARRTRATPIRLTSHCPSCGKPLDLLSGRCGC